MRIYSRPNTDNLQNTPRDGPSQNTPRTPAPDEAEGAAGPAFQTHPTPYTRQPASQPTPPRVPVQRPPRSRAGLPSSVPAPARGLCGTRESSARHRRQGPVRHPRPASLLSWCPALPPPSSSLPISPRSAGILWMGTLRRVGRAPVAAQRARITPARTQRA